MKAISMESSRSSFGFAPLPIFAGKDYHHWQIKMKTFFKSQGLWKIIKYGKTLEPTKISEQMHKEEKLKNAHALHFIQQAVSPIIFVKIMYISSASLAWAILNKEYYFETKFLEGKDFETDVPEISEAIEWPSRCICKVDKEQRDLNQAAYSPQLISIGPIHHGRPELADMVKHKLYYGKCFLERSGKQKALFVRFLTKNETGHSKYGYKTLPEYADDSLLHEPLLRDRIRVDLLLFENQLPYLVLANLHQLAGANKEKWVSLTELFSSFFCFFIPIFSFYPLEKFSRWHILGWVRDVSPSLPNLPEGGSYFGTLSDGAKKLSDTRVRIIGTWKSTSVSYYNIQRLLEVPIFKVDNNSERIYSNLIAMEKCVLKQNPVFFSYFRLLGMLIKSRDDVEILIKSGVVINSLGSNQAVVDLVDSLVKNVVIDKFHYKSICDELNDYSRSWMGWWNYCWTVLKRNYFNNLWKGTATIAAVFIVILTMTQTITSILQVKIK
ncbi:UPF0481 protein At3g47200-like [Rutidosis leptorrhynchoides]|uniref:UPF0481 protein At3g47200-like n=1 Tax=Rutidosis leptorrhynchoides TaxID=125765 RepID=UPI003A98E99E